MGGGGKDRSRESLLAHSQAPRPSEAAVVNLRGGLGRFAACGGPNARRVARQDFQDTLSLLVPRKAGRGRVFRAHRPAAHAANHARAAPHVQDLVSAVGGAAAPALLPAAPSRRVRAQACSLCARSARGAHVRRAKMFRSFAVTFSLHGARDGRTSWPYAMRQRRGITVDRGRVADPPLSAARTAHSRRCAHARAPAGPPPPRTLTRT